MKKILRRLVKAALPPTVRQRIKRYQRRVEASRIDEPLTEAAFRDVLVRDLGLRQGDSVLVHASFGRIKAAFPPTAAVSVLQDVVGRGGNILMPVYPGNGDEWLAADEIFDPLTSEISTGVLAAKFARMPDVQVSVHPIKAVAAWGHDSVFLTTEHELSATPFDAHSPYAKLLTLHNAKAVGFGTSRMSFIHCGEDSVPDYVERVYSADAKPGRYRLPSGEVVTVATRVHRGDVMRDTPGADFLETRQSTACRKLDVAGRSYYVGDLPAIYDHMRNYATEYARQPR